MSWLDTLNSAVVRFNAVKCLPSSSHFEGTLFHGGTNFDAINKAAASMN